MTKLPVIFRPEICGSLGIMALLGTNVLSQSRRAAVLPSSPTTTPSIYSIKTTCGPPMIDATPSRHGLKRWMTSRWHPRLTVLPQICTPCITAMCFWSKVVGKMMQKLFQLWSECQTTFSLLLSVRVTASPANPPCPSRFLSHRSRPSPPAAPSRSPTPPASSRRPLRPLSLLVQAALLG